MIWQIPRTTTSDRIKTNDYKYEWIGTLNIGTLNDKVEEVTAGIISEEDKLKENMLSLLKEITFEEIQ